TPSLSKNLAAADVNACHHSFAVRIEHRFDGGFAFENIDISFELPAVVPDVLAKISVTIKQTDGDERDVQVAGGFKVIACQNAEPAGIIRQGIVHAVFGAEIRSRAFGGNLAETSRNDVRVFAEFACESIDAFGEFAVGGDLRQAKRAHFIQNGARILFAFVPKMRVYFAEKPRHFGLPRPIKVHRKLVKSRDIL